MAGQDDLEFKVIANDDASAVLDDVTKKALKLEKLDPEIEISADGGKAEKEVKSLGERLEDLTDREQEIVLKASVAQAEDDLKRLERSLRGVRDMTDDELQIRLRAIDNATEDLEEARRLRDDLNGKDVEINVDVNQAGRQSLQGLKGDLDGVHDSGDQSRSVLANMAGNTAQDLGEVGGVVGSLGVGLGQLAEYATEGNIKLSNLAKVAGPMAGLAAAGLVVQTVFAGIETEKAFKAEQVERFTDALKEGRSVLQVINDELRETGKLSYVGSGGLLDLGKETKDLTAVARDAGLSYEQFLKVLQDADAPDRFREKVRALREEQEKTDIISQRNALAEQAVIYGELARGVGQYQESIGLATTQQQELNEWIGNNAAANREQARIYGEVSSGVLAARDTEEERTAALSESGSIIDDARQRDADLAAAREESAQKARDAQQAELDLIAVRRSAADATFALQDAQDKFAQTTQSLNEDVKLAKGDQEALNQVYRDAARDGIAVADAQVRLAQEQAKTIGVTLNAKDTMALFNRTALEQAAALDGPAQQALIDYIAQVNNVPPKKATEILPILDQFGLDAAVTAIDIATAPREVPVRLQVTNEGEVLAILGGGRFARAAGGGTESGGVYRYGEGGRPEVWSDAFGNTWMLPTRNGSIRPLEQVSSSTTNVGGTTTIINNLPPGMAPRQFTRAQRNAQRRGFGRAR